MPGVFYGFSEIFEETCCIMEEESKPIVQETEVEDDKGSNNGGGSTASYSSEEYVKGRLWYKKPPWYSNVEYEYHLSMVPYTCTFITNACNGANWYRPMNIKGVIVDGSLYALHPVSVSLH